MMKSEYKNWARGLLLWVETAKLSAMIRPFHLRDLALVHRLSEQGVTLHTESALTKNLHPVRGALFSLMGGDFPTYVWKTKERDVAGFIQLCLEDNIQYANILYISADKSPGIVNNVNRVVGRANNNTAVINKSAWLSLLDQAVVEVGQRGVHSLVAEVNEVGPELPILRHAGFVVYTRQDIWVLHEQVVSPEDNDILSQRQEIDDWEIQLLYANTVPRLVQMVEPMPPLNGGTGWVLREDNEITAFVHIQDGSAGTWMRLFIHPNAEARADEIVLAVTRLHPPYAEHPIYCCVRRYQSWVQGSLERVGFELVDSQAVMVKHTVHHLKRPLPDLTAALDAQGVTPTAPYVRNYE